MKWFFQRRSNWGGCGAAAGNQDGCGTALGNRDGCDTGSGNQNGCGAAGFTLIELLVAMVVLALLGAGIAGVLKNATDSVEQGTRSIDQTIRLRSLEYILGGAIREARAIQLSQQEKRYLEQDGAYDAAEGDYRFRGEELSLGFCLERPFLSAERDGYMHWIVVEVREDEESGNRQLWMSDTSFLRGVDNPVGEDWASDSMFKEGSLPKKEVLLIDEVKDLNFKYWRKEEGEVTAESANEEMEAEDVAGDYALELPDYIEMEIRLPKSKTERLVFDYAVRRDEME